MSQLVNSVLSKLGQVVWQAAGKASGTIREMLGPSIENSRSMGSKFKWNRKWFDFHTLSLNSSYFQLLKYYANKTVWPEKKQTRFVQIFSPIFSWFSKKHLTVKWNKRANCSQANPRPLEQRNKTQYDILRKSSLLKLIAFLNLHPYNLETL